MSAFGKVLAALTDPDAEPIFDAFRAGFWTCAAVVTFLCLIGVLA